MNLVIFLARLISIFGRKLFHDSAASNPALVRFENNDAANILDGKEKNPWPQTFAAFQLSP